MSGKDHTNTPGGCKVEILEDVAKPNEAEHGEIKKQVMENMKKGRKQRSDKDKVKTSTYTLPLKQPEICTRKASPSSRLSTPSKYSCPQQRAQPRLCHSSSYARSSISPSPLLHSCSHVRDDISSRPY